MSATGNYIVESDVNNWPTAVAASENFATTAVNITTNVVMLTNDIPTATELRFRSTGALPLPLVVGTIYYAIRVDATHVKAATTPVNAAAGTAIDLTTVGSGTHTVDIGGGSSEANRQATIDRVEQLIEAVTQDYFYSKAFAQYYDGNNKNRLSLGLIPNILAVTEIKISGVVLTVDWWTYDDASVYLNPETASGLEVELAYRLQHGQKLFPRGVGNIKVTGTQGWTVCPAAIKQAAIMLCRYENDPTFYTRYEDVDSDKLGDAAYSRGVDKEFLTGIHEADRLIRNYIRKKPVMGIA